MAGNDYFDADAYLAEQNQAFSNAVLAGNQNGISPLPEAASPAIASPPEDRSSMFRRLMSSGAPGMVGSALGGPVIGKAVGALSDSAFPREQSKNTEPYGPSNAFRSTVTEATPMNSAYPEIKAAPTLAEQARKAVGAGAGLGGGGGSNGLLADWRRAQQGQLDSMSQGADLQRGLGIDKAAAMQEMSGLRAQQAQRMQEDADQQMRIEADTNQRHEAFLAQSQKLADVVTSQNVDPARFLRSADAKTQLLFGLGSALGGALSAVNGGPNQFLDRLDALADKDFKGQLANLDNARAGLSARNTIYGQIMAQTQDRRLADLQARDLMYTAMKTKLLADADRLGIPEVRAQADIAANAIEERRAGLQTQMAQQSYQSAQAAAAANAAQQRAAEERAWQRAMDVEKLHQNQQEIDIKAGKEGPNSKEAGERKVVLDGQDALAVNKTAAEKWNEYNHGREVFNLALQKLIKARDAGDVGSYDAARAQLIEEYPKLLGYTRAPTEGQISHTVGPNAIPEYNHWYSHAQYGPAGVATYSRDQGRGQEKIDFLKETLSTSDKSMRENTFGAAAGKPKMPDTVVVKK